MVLLAPRLLAACSNCLLDNPLVNGFVVTVGSMIVVEDKLLGCRVLRDKLMNYGPVN
jgi:hypothetical protein